MFLAHAGINQSDLWERWYACGSDDERSRIHVVWWMDPATDESASPTLVHSSSPHRMFRNDNQYSSDTRTYRHHHSVAVIELKLLRFAYDRFPSSHHYHLLSGACIPIKAPSIFVAPFLPDELSYLCIAAHERTLHNLAKSVGIKWFDSHHFAYVHCQFWILNNIHARLIIRLVFENNDATDYVEDLVKIQREFCKMKMNYDDLTDSNMSSEYDVSLTAPCEWFIFTLLAQALLKYRKVSDVRDVTQQINLSHGIFQHHVRHGIDHHPIEYPDLDTKVNVHSNSIKRGVGKRKQVEFEQASLRQVLSENVMTASVSKEAPLALWNDKRVIIVRKIGKNPITENTWPTNKHE
jgi:hypothetical protein